MLINEMKCVVLRKDPSEMVEWFAKRTEAERSKLAKPAYKFKFDLSWTWRTDRKVEKQLKADIAELGFDFRKATRCDEDDPSFDVLLLATQPASELKQMNLTFCEEGVRNRNVWDDAMVQALKDRKLGKINEVVDSLLASNHRDAGGVISAAFILALIEAGVIEQPDSQDYLRALSDLLDKTWTNAEGIRKQRAWLIGNQAFLQRDAYRLLHFESDIFFNPRKTEWQKLYRQLSKSGHLDRGEVLLSVVRGMHADFKQNVLRGMVKFFESLEPTLEELTPLASDLSKLLGSAQSAIGKSAFTTLKNLHGEGKLDDEMLLKLLPPVFDCPAKGTPKAAVTLIGKLSRSKKELVPQCVEAVMPALGHLDADVQAAVLKWLASVKDRLHGDHLIAIGQHASELAATNRKAAEQLVGAKATSSSEPVAASMSTQTAPERSIQESQSEPITPILDHEELIDEIARAIEMTESGEQAERIFEAISRLGVIPDHLAERAAPVLASVLDKHTCPREPHAGSRSLCETPDASPMVRRVLACALGGEEDLARERVTKEHPHANEGDAVETMKDLGKALFRVSATKGFTHVASYEPYLDYNPEIVPQGLMDYPWGARVIWQRMEVIEARLRRGVKLPLLAAPTDQHGWIDPVALIFRLALWHAAEEPVDDVDFILSLMRLSSEGRSDAVEAAAGLPPVHAAVLRLALDADPQTVDPPRESDAAILNVAAHVRTQPIDESQVNRLGLDAGYVCGGLPLLEHWRLNEAMPVKPKTREDYLQPSVIQTWKSGTWIEAHPVLGEIHRFRYLGISTSRWKTHTDAWNDHRALDPYWLTVTSCIAARLEKGATNYAAVSQYFDALFDARAVWSIPACGAVTVAMASKDNDASMTAMDALCDAISADRVDSETFVDAMIRVFVAPFVRPKRFAENFALVADASPLHRRFVGTVLGRLIQSWCSPSFLGSEKRCDRLARAIDCGPLLQLYAECLAELGASPTEEQQAAFTGVKAKGNVAKLLKQICASAIA